MSAFLKSINNKTWKSVLKGWSPPQIKNAEGVPTGVKDEVNWTEAEDLEALGNSQALNAIFNGVDKNVFRLINTCTTAKAAWEILATAYEGTTKVREQKLQYLTTNFEALNMKEDETVAEFNVRIRDLSNESYSLGEPMSDEKLVRKTLRALNSKFRMKITAIEEVHDLKTLKFDELMGSLMTYELSLPSADRRNKGIALSSSIQNKGEKGQEESDDEETDETIAMMAKNYNRAMKRFNRLGGRNVNPDVRAKVSPKVPKTVNDRSNNSGDYSGRNKGLKCHECEGFGHYQRECPNFLRKQKKGYSATLSDEEDGDSETEEVSNFVAFTAFTSQTNTGEPMAVANSPTSPVNDDWTDEQLNDAYCALYTKWIEESHILERQGEQILALTNDKTRLLETIIDLKREAIRVTNERDQLLKTVKMLNSGTKDLDRILTIGQSSRSTTGLGYTHTTSTSQTVFVPQKKQEEEGSSKVATTGLTSCATLCPTCKCQRKCQRQGHIAMGTRQRSKPDRRQQWTCSYCGKRGHIRPYCRQLYNKQPKVAQTAQWRVKPTVPETLSTKQRSVKEVKSNHKTRQEWVVKNQNFRANIAYTSLSASTSNDWYFDSGCSRHMTGTREFLINIKPYKNCFVTFGDGAKAYIIGKGQLVHPGAQCLTEALLVEGLKPNLISIGQLCDLELNVNFTKTKCLVLDQNQGEVMQGKRSFDNCYLWTPE